jgi:hypothetical protein
LDNFLHPAKIFKQHSIVKIQYNAVLSLSAPIPDTLIIFRKAMSAFLYGHIDKKALSISLETEKYNAIKN